MMSGCNAMLSGCNAVLSGCNAMLLECNAAPEDNFKECSWLDATVNKWSGFNVI